LAGLEVALMSGDHPHVAILAVDMPFLNADWFEWLACDCAPGVGAVARHSAAFEPLAAIYPRTALVAVSRRLDQGALSLQDLIRTLVTDGMMYARELPDNRLPAARSLNSIG